MTVSNGLGPWWLPSPIRAWMTGKTKRFFREASWIKHDEGYARGYPDRATCDRNFLQAMLRDAAANKSPALTSMLALLLWFLVRIGGWLSYRK